MQRQTHIHGNVNDTLTSIILAVSRVVTQAGYTEFTRKDSVHA